MQMVDVVSSNIAAIGHEGTTLQVKFKTGATYVYMGVSAALHASLMAAESIGGFFDKEIKKAGFAFSKL